VPLPPRPSSWAERRDKNAPSCANGVQLRRVSGEADVRAMSAMQDSVFGDPVSDRSADALLRRLARGDGMDVEKE